MVYTTLFVFLLLFPLTHSYCNFANKQSGCYYSSGNDTYCCENKFEPSQLRNINVSKIELRRVDMSGGMLSNITLSPSVTELVIDQAEGLKFLGQFQPNKHLSILDIKSTDIREIDKDAFNNLKSLSVLQLEKCNIKELKPGTFDNLKDLTLLNLKDNRLTQFPHFGVQIYLVKLFLDNNEISLLEPGQMENISFVEDLRLTYNKFEVIPNGFFEKKIVRLDLNGTPIHYIEENAFANLQSLIKLSLDGTNIATFPTNGLKKLKILSLKNCPNLFSIPRGLDSIENVTVSDDKSFLCCRFILSTKDKRVPSTKSPLTPTQQTTVRVITQQYNSSIPFVKPMVKDVSCDPGPNEFQPCENIMGAQWLTVISFIVAPFALCGNLVVIIVFLCTVHEYNVSRFLITNLAIADMCMGIYLLCLVTQSVMTSGEYYNHVEDFQYGASCKALGFLAMFSSELSVVSLTLITVERYLTIVYALYPKWRLTMKHAVVCMVFGWSFAITVALLPLLEISRYTKVAVCLPFDIAGNGIYYLVFVFCFNGASFIFIAVLYLRIYYSVFLPNNSTPTRGHDTRVARRMAVLVLTDFACFAPIVITALASIYGTKLISVAQSKYLLVFFFPLNSFMNPFLYALITKSFRRDFAVILKRCFVCGESLSGYLTTALPARSAQSQSDIFSRTRQSVDFNTMDTMSGSANNLNGATVAALYRKTEPSLVRFQHVNLGTRVDETPEKGDKVS